MKRNIFCIIVAILLIFAIGGCNKTVDENDNTLGIITEIAIDDVKGISSSEAEELYYSFMGKEDKETGFPFSFGTSGAIQKDGKQYYVIRASWLVENSHLSYIGDFFVSADGKEIYDGVALQGEYEILNKVWSEHYEL